MHVVFRKPMAGESCKKSTSPESPGPLQNFEDSLEQFDSHPSQWANEMQQGVLETRQMMCKYF